MPRYGSRAPTPDATKLLKFEGHYHGWYDETLISSAPGLEQAGPPQAPKSVLASGGQPASAGENIIVLPWNDSDLVRATIQSLGHELAAVIMEPVMCNSGCIPPLPGYLETVRDLCAQYGIVLIFDEVITGFRLALGAGAKLLRRHAGSGDLWQSDGERLPHCLPGRPAGIA